MVVSDVKFSYRDFIDKDNTKSGIYCILNIKAKKAYIGSAVNLGKRIYQHIYKLVRQKHENDHLQKAWNKYENISFVFIVLEYCEINKLIEKERTWINQFDFENELYNICKEARNRLGTKHSEESKQKMRKVWENRSIEVKNKINESKKGRIVSEETKEKMRIKLAGRKFTEETKIKMQEARKKRIYPPKKVKPSKPEKEQKFEPVAQIDKETDKVIAVFYNLELAGESVNAKSHDIRYACSGYYRTTRGYRWRLI